MVALVAVPLSKPVNRTVVEHTSLGAPMPSHQFPDGTQGFEQKQGSSRECFEWQPGKNECKKPEIQTDCYNPSKGTTPCATKVAISLGIFNESTLTESTDKAKRGPKLEWKRNCCLNPKAKWDREYRSDSKHIYSSYHRPPDRYWTYLLWALGKIIVRDTQTAV